MGDHSTAEIDRRVELDVDVGQPAAVTTGTNSGGQAKVLQPDVCQRHHQAVGSGVDQHGDTRAAVDGKVRYRLGGFDHLQSDSRVSRCTCPRGPVGAKEAQEPAAAASCAAEVAGAVTAGRRHRTDRRCHQLRRYHFRRSRRCRRYRSASRPDRRSRRSCPRSPVAAIADQAGVATVPAGARRRGEAGATVAPQQPTGLAVDARARSVCPVADQVALKQRLGGCIDHTQQFVGNRLQRRRAGQLASHIEYWPSSGLRK